MLRPALAIASLEGKRLARHPAILVMGIIGVLPLVTWSDPDQPLLYPTIELGIFLWGLAGGTMIAANLAVRRPIRDAAREVHDSAPLHPGARTAGHLLAIAVPVVYAVIAVGGVLALWSARGSPGSIDLFEASTGPLLVGGGGVLGVLTARWIPTGFGWLVGMLAVAGIQIAISTIDPESDPMRTLAPFASRDQFMHVDILVRDAGWHLVYLAGLVALGGTIAVARTGAGRRTIAVGLASIMVAGTGGFMQTRPLSEAEAKHIAMVASILPVSCVYDGAISACVQPGEQDRATAWLLTARAVLARAPQRVRDRGLVLEQRYGTSTMRALPPAVQEHLLDGLPAEEPFVWPDIGVVRIDRRGSADPTAIALRVAMWAVGMPLEPGARVATQADEHRLLRNPLRMGAEPPVRAGVPVMLRCTAHGQARAVLALWLTMHDQRAIEELRPGLPGGSPSDGLVDARREVEIVPADRDELLFIEPPTWDSDMPAPALFAVSDLRYAHMMLATPRADTARALSRHWDELTHPATPTSRLVELLDLERLPQNAHELAFDPVEPPCV